MFDDELLNPDELSGDVNIQYICSKKKKQLWWHLLKFNK